MFLLFCFYLLPIVDLFTCHLLYMVQSMCSVVVAVFVVLFLLYMVHGMFYLLYTVLSMIYCCSVVFC